MLGDFSHLEERPKSRTLMRMKFKSDDNSQKEEKILAGRDLRKKSNSLELTVSSMTQTAVNELFVEKLSRPNSRQTNSPVSTECSKLSCHSSNRSSASTNPEWSPKVPSLKSQRNRLRMRSRDNSPSADLSSVIDSKYLAFSQTLGNSIPPKTELRGRSNSISEETVNIATKENSRPSTDRQGRKVFSLSSMRRKMSRSLDRAYNEKPPLPTTELVCLSPTPPPALGLDTDRKADQLINLVQLRSETKPQLYYTS